MILYNVHATCTLCALYTAITQNPAIKDVERLTLALTGSANVSRKTATRAISGNIWLIALLCGFWYNDVCAQGITI